MVHQFRVMAIIFWGLLSILLSSCRESKEPDDTRSEISPDPTVPDKNRNSQRRSNLKPSDVPLPQISQDMRQKHWHLFAEHGINIEAAWEITRGSPDVVIGVIDGGFDTQHPVFNQTNCPIIYTHFDRAYGFKRVPHGVGTASTIGACVNNPLEFIAINHFSPQIWANASAGGNKLYDSNIFLRWMVGDNRVCTHLNHQKFYCDGNQANQDIPQVINLSFGHEEKYIGEYQKTYEVINRINKANIIVVASAGNESRNAENSFPSATTGVISVGAIGQQGHAKKFSNWGETVEVMAPGANVLAAWGGNTLKRVYGTSFAAPIVTSVVSLMRAVNPNLNWKTALYFLQSTSKPLSCDNYCSYEYGQIAGSNAMQTARDLCRADCCRDGHTQTCTPGVVDAAAAVRAAKDAAAQGHVPASLIDVDNYVVRLKKANNHSTTPRTGKFTVYNRGDKSGRYTIRAHKYKNIRQRQTGVTFNRNKINLAPRGEAGDSVTIHVSARTKSSTAFKIRIGSLDSGVATGFTDEIVIVTD